MKNLDRYYYNSSFPLVTFLFAKEQPIVGINTIDGKGKKNFVFNRTPYLEELVDKYKFGDKSDPDLSIQVHIYEQARRMLLDRLND